MEPYDLLILLVKILDGFRIGYNVIGSMATIAYGESRYTHDIDVVVDLHREQVEAFCAAFPAPDFDVSREAARDAILHHRMFNIIHIPSGLKIDVFIPADDEFERSRWIRGRAVRVREGLEFHFASPEDVIVRKLQYYQEGGSEKHLRDIAGVLKVQGDRIDRPYIAGWAERLGVAEIWEQILQRLNEP
jgi:hypothetical protein